jgi:hypothetical protein
MEKFAFKNLFLIWTALIALVMVFLLCDSFKSIGPESAHPDHHPHQHTAMSLAQNLDHGQNSNTAVALGFGTLLFFVGRILEVYKNVALLASSLFLYLLIRWRHPLLQLFRRGILNSKKYNLALV